MTIHRTMVALLVLLAGASSGCTESSPCDSLTDFDRGVCKARPVRVDAGATAGNDGAASAPTFGTPCKDGVNHSDCQGAVVNGCFILPGQAAGFCSYVGCDKDNRCPAGWMCLDLSTFQAGAPWGCVKL